MSWWLRSLGLGWWLRGLAQGLGLDLGGHVAQFEAQGAWFGAISSVQGLDLVRDLRLGFGPWG